MPDRSEVEVPGTSECSAKYHGCTFTTSPRQRRQGQATATYSESLANSGNPRSGLGQRFVDLLQRVPALRRGVDVGMGREKLFGEAFALGARGEQVLARFVAFADADMELRGKALERFARPTDLRARGLSFLGGRGHPGFLLAQLAGEPGDLRQRAVPLGFEKLDIGAEGTQLGAALVQVGGEAGGGGAPVAGFFRCPAESGARRGPGRLQTRLRLRPPGGVPPGAP